MSKRKILSVFLSTALMVTVFTTALFGMAVSASNVDIATTPAKPTGAPSLVTSSTAFTTSDGGVMAATGSKVSCNLVGSVVNGSYALGTVPQDHTYVLKLTVTPTTLYNDHYSGMRLIFRGDAAGDYYAIYFAKGEIILFSNNGQIYSYNSFAGDNNPIYTKDTPYTVELTSTQEAFTLKVNDTYVWKNVSMKNGAGVLNKLAPAVSFQGGLCGWIVSVDDMYDADYTAATTESSTGATTESTNEATTSTTESTEATTTTATAATTTAAPVIDMTKVPSRPSGVNSLLTNKVNFVSDDEEVLSRKDNSLKAALSGQNITGYFDFKGLSTDTAYGFSGKLTITEPYANYSGMRLFIAGSTEGRCYQLAFLKEALYVLDVDYQTGSSRTIHTAASYTYTQNVAQEIDVILNGNRLSVFVDGKAIWSNAQLAETRTPMLAVHNAVAGWTLENMELWDMNAKAGTEPTSGNNNNNPQTGTFVPVIGLITLVSGASAVIAVSRKRNRR